ncbi:MAG: phage tail tape measure protein, partial [Enterococcus lemanii]
MAKGKVLETVINISGEISPTLGKSIDEVSNRLKGINLKGLAVGAAVGGIAIATGKAVFEAGKHLKDLGTSFDEAADAIRIGTGATGAAFEELLDDFDAVYKGVPASMGEASQAIADYNTRLGLTGPQLQDISKQAIQVSSMLGDDLGSVIEESSQAFQQWNIDAEEMGNAMDYIFKTSQSTGMGFTDLMGNMQKFGPQLQEMGYSFESASALMGQLDKAGVNTEEVLGAMKKSVGALAREGISASDGLQMYYEKIRDAGSAAEATAIANEVFGARAGSTMASAIRSGALAVEELTADLKENGETIAGAADDTYDFAERLQIMRQGLEVALKPLANTVFDGLNKFMPVLQKLMERIVPVIGKAVDAAMPFVDDFLAGAADLLEELLPLLADLSEDLFPIFSDLIGSLLPPLLDLARALLPPLMQIVQAILPPIASVLATVLPLLTQVVSAIMPVFNQLISALLPIIT